MLCRTEFTHLAKTCLKQPESCASWQYYTTHGCLEANVVQSLDFAYCTFLPFPITVSSDFSSPMSVLITGQSFHSTQAKPNITASTVPLSTHAEPAAPAS